MSPATTGTDALSELLARLRFRAHAVTIEAIPPGDRWTFDDGSAAVHHVLSGSVCISIADACAIVQAGDVVLLPHGGAHTITALDNARVLTAALRFEGDAASADAVADGLPELMMSCGLAANSVVVGGLVRGILEEKDAGRTAASSLAEGLATLVAVATVRSWAEQLCARAAGDCGDDPGWQLTLRDPHIARAVEAIQNEPGAKWSVAGLARVASSSRSVFAEQFRLAVGAPPLAYLAQVRMERAKQLLTGDGLSVGQTATALGYESDAAFSRAFRRHAGVSPSAWRRSIHQAESAR